MLTIPAVIARRIKHFFHMPMMLESNRDSRSTRQMIWRRTALDSSCVPRRPLLIPPGPRHNSTARSTRRAYLFLPYRRVRLTSSWMDLGDELKDERDEQNKHNRWRGRRLEMALCSPVSVLPFFVAAIAEVAEPIVHILVDIRDGGFPVRLDFDYSSTFAVGRLEVCLKGVYPVSVPSRSLSAPIATATSPTISCSDPTAIRHRRARRQLWASRTHMPGRS